MILHSIRTQPEFNVSRSLFISKIKYDKVKAVLLVASILEGFKAFLKTEGFSRRTFKSINHLIFTSSTNNFVSLSDFSSF